ncbi:hypothetical protein [Moraxella marmotae]|uniref:hypothetical protein n=1 Tax=Moraxella marmotae TaxID=3344520 RepID=UPI0035F3E08B
MKNRLILIVLLALLTGCVATDLDTNCQTTINFGDIANKKLEMPDFRVNCNAR